METLSWTEVDDLRANLRADERARFDAELHDLAVGPEPASDSAYASLIARWRAVTANRADLPAARYPEVHRVGWMNRLTAALH